MQKRIEELADKLYNELYTLSDFVHKNPELGYEEYKSSKGHIELLKLHGFIVEERYLNIDTAFKAVYKNSDASDRVTIAYLAEYDALPGLGHACGHNLLGTASTGAGIILSKLLEEIDVPTEIIIFGTPAEETSGTKVRFAQEGCFDNIDVALMSHPGDGYYKSGKSLALKALEFEFSGVAAHAASNPDKGVNALDAVLNMFTSINALRQQIKSTAKVHGIITNGGKAANIIPDYTSAQFYIRATNVGYLNELTDKVIKCAEFGAMASGCKMSYNDFEVSYKNLVTNETLSALHTRSIEVFGVSDGGKERETFGSLDAGDVSHLVPTIHPYHKIAPTGTIAHTPEFEKYAGGKEAFDANMIATKALALTGCELILDQCLLKKIKEEFSARFID